MSHYQSNLRDLEFNLFELFGAADSPDGADNAENADGAHPVFGQGPYEEIDQDTARTVLAEVARLARDEVAAGYADADRRPPSFDPDTGSVTVGPEIHRAYRALMDAEYWRLDLPEELGGTAAPRSLWWALAELVLGANAPVWMYATGPSFAHTLFREGTPEQQEWAKLFVARRWAATMVLTEPDAGSDVGAGRTRAVPQPDGSWHLEGVKRFITAGEHDLTENIVHYVLARPEGAGPGTKGLSLFVVPKHHFDPTTGELTGRNGVYATNLEDKHGIKASATCELAFGQHGTPAQGWLLGNVHDGIRQMFLIIEYARMMVGTKAIATLSTGYLHALAYARERVQGADLRRAGDKTAPRVTIIHHPDVRRSLLLQKAYAEGLRALVCYAAQWQDRAWLARAAGDDDAAAYADRVNDLLLPVVKGVGAERAHELLGAESLQTLGGSGYLRDYPLEQYLRDAKIDTLYEGTTAIQALDLFFRKIAKDGGVALGAVAGEIEAFAGTDPDVGEDPAGRKQARQALAEAYGAMEGMLGTATRWLAQAADQEPEAVYRCGLVSRRLLLAFGDLLVGWLLQRQAEVAAARLVDGGATAADTAFYQGKVAVAGFFAREVLPRLTADRRVVEATTLDAMTLPAEAF